MLQKYEESQANSECGSPKESRFIVVPTVEDNYRPTPPCPSSNNNVTPNSGEKSIEIERPTKENANKEVQPKEPLIERIRNCRLVSHSLRIYGKTLRTQTSVDVERKRHLDSFPTTIHPYSDLRWYADLVIIFVSTLYLIYQPMKIAFYFHELSNVKWAIFSMICSLIFFLDIFLNFKTGIISKEDMAVVLDSGKVASHYLRTWFIVDLVSSIPYGTIYVLLDDAEGSNNFWLKYFRIIHIFTILRLTRVIHNVKKIETAYYLKNAHTRMFNFIITLFFTLHWLTCWHYLVADMFNNPPYQRNEFSWVSQADLWNRSVWEKYIHSLLRALSNMACSGYGLIPPKTSEDVICTVTSICIGVSFFALFIANLTNILLTLDSPHRKYNESLCQIKEYMKFKRMPKELRERVGNYFEQRYHRSLFNEDEIMNVLSDVLKEQLQMNNCRRLVQSVPIFKGIRNEIIEEIVAQLKFEVYLPKDVIIHENTIGTAMYFIERGTVAIFGPSGKLIDTLHDGNFFGEMALVNNERRSASVIAMTTCDVFLLKKADFERVVQQYNEVYASIVRIAKKRARERKISEPEGPVGSEITFKTSALRRPARKSVQEVDFVLTP